MILLDAFAALGTKWWVEIFDDDASVRYESEKRKLETAIRRFEMEYSRFVSDSLVNRLNRERHIDNPPAELSEMVRLGLDLERETGGIFSMNIGHILAGRGYGKSVVASGHGSGKVKNEGNSIIIEGDGEIDLGGIGKGYLIGKLADIMKNEFGRREFLINGGGDIYGTAENGKPIRIEIEHPFRPGTAWGMVPLLYSGVCVSSPALRSWIGSSGNKETHFVDPRDPNRAYGSFCGSVVVGNDPVICDALATVFCIAGPGECVAIAEKFGVVFSRIPPDKT